MNTNGACYVASLRGDRRSTDQRNLRSPILRLTLELVTVGDFALPVAGLFVHVKGQSAGARDLLQAGPCTPAGEPTGTENKKGACVSLRGEKDVTIAYSRADRSSSRSSSSRRSAVRCRTRDPWGTSPLPA